MRVDQGIFIVSVLSMMLVDAAQARVFRCTDADGKVGYSQVPCPAEQQADQMRGIGGGKQQDRSLCGDARDLAAQAFGDMGSRVEPSEVIEQYGGINYINAATLGVINFAASLRFNTDITPQRAGALAFSRCLGGGFGELHPGDLPKIEQEQTDQPDVSAKPSAQIE